MKNLSFIPFYGSFMEVGRELSPLSKFHLELFLPALFFNCPLCFINYSGKFTGETDGCEWGDATAICHQKKETGPCRGNFQRWYGRDR
jgi:hypothetical protein